VQSLAKTVGLNERHGRPDLRLFEIGRAFRASDTRTTAIPGVVEMEELALVLSGRAEPVAWDVPARSYDLFDLRGLVERYLSRIGVAAIEFRPSDDARWGFDAPALELHVGGEEVGRLGPLDPWLRERHDIAGEPVIAVIDLERLVPHVDRPAAYRAPSRFPVVRRDLSIIVDEAKRHAELETAIRASGGPLLSDVELFDVFRGQRLGAGRVSLAYSVAFTSYEGTLDDATVESAMRAIIERLRTEHGAELRGA
jgi:phenylalanyl-tRNA synthetase beta chain